MALRIYGSAHPANEVIAAGALAFWDSVQLIEDGRRAALTALLREVPDDEAARLLMAEIQRSAEILFDIAKHGRAANARR